MTPAPLPPGHPVFLAVQQLAQDVFRFAAHGAPAAVPFNRQLAPGALDAHLANSPASRVVAWQGSKVALAGWQSVDGVWVAVSDRKSGRTFAAHADDQLGVLQLAALGGAWATSIKAHRLTAGDGERTTPAALRHLIDQNPLNAQPKQAA